MDALKTNARSFEQDLLWSILDRDAVPDILRMANDRWGIDAAATWRALQQADRLGRLRGYRGVGDFTPVDLTAVSFADVVDDLALFVEPTAATRTALAQFRDDAPTPSDAPTEHPGGAG